MHQFLSNSSIYECAMLCTIFWAYFFFFFLCENISNLVIICSYSCSFFVCSTFGSVLEDNILYSGLPIFLKHLELYLKKFNLKKYIYKHVQHCHWVKCWPTIWLTTLDYPHPLKKQVWYWNSNTYFLWNVTILGNVFLGTLIMSDFIFFQLLLL